MQTIFGNMEDLCFFAADLLELLDAKLDAWGPAQTLADVFAAEAVELGLRRHIDYCDQYMRAQQTLAAARRRCGRLAEFLKECGTRARDAPGLRGLAALAAGCPSNGESDLEALLLKPAQFVARLLAAVREIDAATAAAHPDKHAARLLVGATELFVQRVNQNFCLKDFAEILRCTPDDSGNPQLMGDTLAGLVDKLVHYNISDPNYQDVFFTTYRTFCSPAQLLDRLIARFARAQHEPLAVRRKLLQIVSAWVSLCWRDLLEDNSAVLGRLQHFLAGSAIDAQAKPFAENVEKILLTNLSQPPPAPVLPALRPAAAGPAPKGPVPLLEFSVKSLVHCLSVQDYMLFAAIQPEELSNKKWEKPNAPALCPNVVRCMRRFNALTEWMKGVLRTLTGNTTVPAKVRSSLVARLMELCHGLLEARDMFAFVALMYGLLMLSDQRSKELQKDITVPIDEWKELVNPEHNYSHYRAFVRNIQPPCVPFLGVTIKDLTFIDDGNPDFLDETEHTDSPIINFYKRRKFSEMIDNIRKFQQIPFVEVNGLVSPQLWNAVLAIGN